MTRNDDFYDTYEAAQLRQQEMRRRERRAMAKADWQDDGLPEGWDEEEEDNGLER